MENNSGELATRGKRLAGVLIDGMIGGAIMLLFLLVTGLFHEMVVQKHQSFGLRALVAGAGLALFLILNGYLLAKHGQTIDKRLIGTRIVDMQGNIPPFAKCFSLDIL